MHPVNIFTYPWIHEGAGIQIRTNGEFLRVALVLRHPVLQSSARLTTGKLPVA